MLLTPAQAVAAHAVAAQAAAAQAFAGHAVAVAGDSRKGGSSTLFFQATAAQARRIESPDPPEASPQTAEFAFLRMLFPRARRSNFIPKFLKT